MCHDNPDVTCTCEKKFQTFTINNYDELEQIQGQSSEAIPPKKKKKRMSRIEKQSMYGGK